MPPSLRRLLPTGALLVGALLTLPGCVLHSSKIARTREAFAQQHPKAQFEREVMLDLGPLSLWATDGVLHRFIDDASFEKARPYLRYLHRAEVGVYAVSGLPSLRASAGATLLPDQLHEDGWKTVVRVRDAGEHVWILARPERRASPLRRLYVLALRRDELVAARLEGDLDRLTAHLLGEYGPHLPFLAGSASRKTAPSTPASPTEAPDSTEAPPISF